MTTSKDIFDDNHVGKRNIIKMTQKLSKKDDIPANEQIQKMVIDNVKGIVITYYHMEDG